MKIGIFGDSFADSKNGGAEEEQKISWPELLAKKYKVDHRACAGSGADWAVEEMIADFQKYDKIILTFSSLDRYYINPMWHDKLQGIKNENLYKHVRPIQKRPLKPENKFFQDVHVHAQNYFKFFENGRFCDNRSAAYCLLIKHLGDKVLPIKNRIEEYPEEYADIKWPNKMGLSEIYQYENTLLFGTRLVKEKHMRYDKRSCHITAWHHEVVYNKIVKWIEGGKFSLTKKDLLKLDSKQVKARYYGTW